MNRSRIEYCDHTFNPVTGCRHGCTYCYASRMVKRFSGDARYNLMAKADYTTVPAADGSAEVYVLEKPMVNGEGSQLIYPFAFMPTYHRYRVKDCPLDKLSTGCTVFVGAMCDLFGNWVPEDWIYEIFEACKSRSQHQYLFLTKNPSRYDTINLPDADNFWWGTSITGSPEDVRIAFLPKENAWASIEPLRGPIAKDIWQYLARVNWIVIGAETGNNRGKIKPKKEWIDEIVRFADYNNIPVYMKDSLSDIIDNLRRDKPPKMTEQKLAGKLARKMFAHCGKCRKRMLKSEMITISARSTRGEMPKKWMFLCKECFKSISNELKADIPELKGLK